MLSGFRKYLLLLAFAAVAGYGGWQHFVAIPQVATVHLTRGPAVEAVYASGTVEPTVMIKIAPKIPGRLADLLVDEGDRVKTRQPLARLDDRELAATVTQLQAKLVWAEREAARAQALLARHTGTVQERDRTAGELDAARAALAVVEQQRAEYTLTAPEDGAIIRRDGEVGDLIPTGQAVFVMSGGEPFRITADVDEEDIPLVHPGQKVLIRADAFPGEKFDGTVEAVTPQGDAVERNFRVRVKIPENTPLRIGMTTELNIVTGAKQDVPLLPASAVGGGKVWVVREGRLRNITVATGVTGAAMVEIKSGLDENDAVVTQPESWFRPELRVRAVPAADGRRG